MKNYNKNIMLFVGLLSIAGLACADVVNGAFLDSINKLKQSSEESISTAAEYIVKFRKQNQEDSRKAYSKNADWDEKQALLKDIRAREMYIFKLHQIFGWQNQIDKNLSDMQR